MNCFKHRHVMLFQNIILNLPKKIQDLISGVDLVADVDPAYIDLHRFSMANDNRSYAETSHAVWPCHQRHKPRVRRRSTVVLGSGDWEDKFVILHELGHILDERLEFDRPEFIPLDDYAATNQYEAFATAFQSWATEKPTGLDYHHSKEDLFYRDNQAFMFFDKLSQ